MAAVQVEQGIRLFLVVLLFIGTCTNNGVILALIYRFETLRTTPNFFILSSSVVDILAGICNLPGLVATFVFRDTTYFVGRRLSLVLSTSHVFFTLLNLFSLTLLMVDRLCAIRLNVKYRAWRSKSRARVIIAVKWTFTLALSLLLDIPIWDIDLGDAPSYRYRQEYFETRGLYIVVILFPLIIANNVIFAMMTCRSITSENKVNTSRMDARMMFHQLRKKNEMRAIKTIGITVLLYLLFYLPAVIYGYLAINNVVSQTHNSWLAFFALLSIFVPGFANPIVFAVRTNRFRRAIKLLIDDPLGTSEIADCANKYIIPKVQLVQQESSTV